MANLKRESNFKEDAIGDGGKAHGIAQWHPDRQANFKKQFGKDIKDSSFKDQLAFVQFELTQGTERGAGNKLKGAKTAEDAASIVSKSYERPADAQGEADKRAKLASAIMGTPGALQAAQSAGAAPTAQATAANTSNTRSVETKVDTINIQTQAKDAPGIAAAIGDSLKGYMLTSQATTGLF